MSVAMEIPDVPAAPACARCGALKVSGQPCPRCGTTANRPRPLQRVRLLAEGIAFTLLILAFCAGAWALVIWLSLQVWGLG